MKKPIIYFLSMYFLVISVSAIEFTSVSDTEYVTEYGQISETLYYLIIIFISLFNSYLINRSFSIKKVSIILGIFISLLVINYSLINLFIESKTLGGLSSGYDAETGVMKHYIFEGINIYTKYGITIYGKILILNILLTGLSTFGIYFNIFKNRSKQG